MVCCPVGNQIKFKNVKADIALSGYCTAPDAALAYFQDPKKDKTIECRHSFNTTPMRRGVTELLNIFGFLNGERTFNSTIDPLDLTIEPKFLFTQMLCMISPNGKSNAKDVDAILRAKRCFREQANSSLTAWYERIKFCLKDGGELILMGEEAIVLAFSSRIDDKGRVTIDFEKPATDISKILYFDLTKRYKVFQTYHAAHIARGFKAWKKSDGMKSLHLYLRKKYPRQTKDTNFE